jgi:hydrogenase-1 operon protein HyaE
MPSPLVRSMIETNNYPVLDADNIEAFLQSHEDVVLFLVGDPNSFPEGNDVAVILPEIMKVFSDRLSVAVVGKAIEREVQLRYRVKGWPSLVVVRRGGYLGAIIRVQDWDDYIEEINSLLAKEPSEPPPLDIKSLCGAMN